MTERKKLRFLFFDKIVFDFCRTNHRIDSENIEMSFRHTKVKPVANNNQAWYNCIKPDTLWRCPMQTNELNELFERQLGEFSAAGWEIVARTNLAAQLKQPKRFDWLTLIAGILLSPALVGFIMIFHVLISYTMGKRMVINLTAQDVAAGRVPDFNEIGKFYYEKKGFWLFLGFLLLLVILFFVFLALLSVVRNV